MSARRVIDAIGANMVLRIGSFAMSMLLTRLSTPESRGMSFQAEVVVNTVGFISREALRCLYSTYPYAIQSQKRRGGAADAASSDKKRARTMAGLLSMAALALPLALLAMCLLEVLAFFLPIPSASRLAFVQESQSGLPIALWFAGLIIEWGSEPLVAIVTASHEFRIRVVAEALALALSKGAAVVALIVGGSYISSNPSYLVGLQQVVYGLITALVLFASVFIFPKPSAKQESVAAVATAGAADATGSIEDLTLFEAKTLAQAVVHTFSLKVLLTDIVPLEVKARFSGWSSYFSETALRLVLTEGEKLILSAYVAIGGQGVFDVVNTLGSLVARLVFKVWEEGSFNVWKGKVSAADENTKTSKSPQHNKEDAGSSKSEPHYIKCVEEDCLPMLQSLTRICFYIGSFTLILAQPLPRFALAFVFSNRWAGDEATAVLRMFCAYIPLMGVNGLLEAFLRATARKSVFTRMQQLMIGTSILSIGTTLLFVRTLELGVVGLMTASIINVVVRMSVNLMLLNGYLRGAFAKVLQINSMGPLFGLVVAANVVFACMSGFEVGSEVNIKGLGVALGLVAMALVAIVPLAYRIEKRSPNTLLLKKKV